jgi:hypothetical protein
MFSSKYFKVFRKIDRLDCRTGSLHLGPCIYNKNNNNSNSSSSSNNIRDELSECTNELHSVLRHTHSCTVYCGTHKVFYKQWKLNIQNAGWLLGRRFPTFRRYTFPRNVDNHRPKTAPPLRRPEFSLKETVITWNVWHLPTPADTWRGPPLLNNLPYCSLSHTNCRWFFIAV